MGIGHQHSPEDKPAIPAIHLAGMVALCMILSATGLVTSIAGIPLNALAACIGGSTIVFEAFKQLLRLRLSADLAVCIAAAAAISIGEHFVAAEVILIMLVGGFLEDLAVGRTRSAISKLIKLAPREATLIAGTERRRVPVDSLEPGQRVAIAPGERVPVDGTVSTGHSSVDQSALTGESLPLDIGPEGAVLAGTLNGAGALEVVVRRVGHDTAFGRMIHLVEEAELSRAPVQRVADRFVSFFLPVVLLMAGVTYAWSGEIVRAVAVLVIACPCALVLATPTAISAGIGRLARQGVLVKGGAALEALARCQSILLDKTGTLTLAQLEISEAITVGDTSETALFRTATALELASEHPLAKAVVREASRRKLNVAVAGNVVAKPGLGVTGTAGHVAILAGSESFIREMGIAIPDEIRDRVNSLTAEGRSIVYVAENGSLLGAVAARDQARSEAKEAVGRLNALFPEAVCMLTGDTAGAADALAAEVGIADVRSELLPEDKTRLVKEFSRDCGPTVMIGDGINDAAALATADVGIALTDVGTDVAIEAADISIFAEGHLTKVVDSVVFARRVLRTIRQNLILFALGINTICVGIAAMGWVGPVMAAVLHQISSLFVVLNSLRLLWSVAEVKAGVGRLPKQFRGGTVWVMRWVMRPVLSALPVLYVLSGFYIVGPDSIGIVRRFGRAGLPVAAGMHYRLPWPMTRLTRLRPEAVGRVEIGFRSGTLLQASAPPAYEWNIQHRGGRYRVVPEESLMTCGDQSFLDVTAVAHFRILDPIKFAFATRDPQTLIRTAAESALREVIAQIPLEDILTLKRDMIEERSLRIAESIIRKADMGAIVTGVNLQDVHPPLDIVDAFRQVVDVLEQKEATINRALAYSNAQLPLARGQSEQLRREAEAYAAEKVASATGEAGSFSLLIDGRRNTPGSRDVTDFRLYMQSVEKAIAGASLTIVDADLPGRKGFVLMDPGAMRLGLRDATGAETTDTGSEPELPSSTGE